MVVDNRSIQQAAWKVLQDARKRLTKASADIHRHENVDTPDYRKWVSATFPVLLTTVRELMAECTSKSDMVRNVEMEASFKRKLPAEIWYLRKQEKARAQEQNQNNPVDGSDANPEDGDSSAGRSGFGEDGTSDGDPFADQFSEDNPFKGLFDDFVAMFEREYEPPPEVSLLMWVGR
jgi:hypothetical protein